MSSADSDDAGHTADVVTARGGASVGGERLAPGALVGNYVIERERSAGGFGAVYRVRHQTLGRVAAIKILHKHLSTSAVCVQRFIQEAKAVNVIRHPNLVDIYEFGETPDGRPYHVMEWLDGRDLLEELQVRGAFSPSEALAIMEQIGDALGAMHAEGVVHRDLKAANIVLVPARDGGTPHVKLVDFGIAKLLGEGGAQLTRTGMRVGTPWSMAPEQIREQVVDTRADIYALGVLLHQMLTGRLPFDAPSALEVEELHLHAPPPRTSDLMPTLAAFDDVVLRCLAKDPAARPPSVAAFLAELRAAVAQSLGRTPAERMHGIALHLEVRLADDGGDLDDRLIDTVEAMVDEARARVAGAGMVLVVDSATSLLAIAVLPADADESRRLRDAVLAHAAEVERAIGATATQHGIDYALVVHAAPLVARRDGDRLQPLGGELLSPTHWTTTPATRACVTPAALSGLEARYVTRSTPSPSLLQLLGRA